jgi:AbiV family abortive infection protein
MKNHHKTKLFEALFLNRQRDQSIELMANGITELVQNAGRLYEDAIILIENSRWTGAKIFLTTADEEMAKVYILIDCCRLDFTRHHSVLKKLIDAFYDHTIKHAYINVIRNTESDNIQKILEEWRYGIEYFEEPVDGEGDPPISYHATHFTREIPLYIDFEFSDQSWTKPASHLAEYSQAMGYGQTWVEESLAILKRSQNDGLFSAEVLTIFNEEFQSRYINDKISIDIVKRINMKIAAKIENLTGIKKDLYNRSALNMYPLYHCLTLSK